MKYYENKRLDLPYEVREGIPKEMNAVCTWNCTWSEYYLI